MDMKGHSEKGQIRGKKLLIVDDVRLFLQLTKTLFSREEYVIHTAANGPKALEIAREHVPDLILLDLVMPGMEGDEVCRLIRSEPVTRDIPVIMISSRSDEESRRRCLYAGCDDFLTKPVSLEVLNQTVEKHLGEGQRKFPRLDVVLPCILDSGLDQLFTNILTLSAGGAFVLTESPPPPGSENNLTFFLPGEEETISVKALARWNRLVPGERPPGSGFEFVGKGEKDVGRLGRWARATRDLKDCR